MYLNFSVFCSNSVSKSLFRKIYMGLISFIFLCATNLNCLSQQPPILADDIKKAIESFIQKGNESESAKDYNQASFYYHQAGNAYWSHDKLAEAIDLFKRSLAMSEQLSNFNGMAVLNTKIGLLYTEISNYESSLIYFTKSLDITRKINRKADIVSSLLNVANAYFELDQYKEAIPLLIEAENLSKDLADTKFLRNCYSIMTNVYDKVGDRERSTQYFNLFAALTKKIQQDEIAKKESEAKLMVDKANSKVQEVESANEVTQLKLKEKSRQLFDKQIDLNKAEQVSMEQQLQIDFLNKEKELQQAVIKQQRLMRNVFLGIILTGLTITSLILFGYRKIKKANTLLNQKNIEISLQKDEIGLQAEELRELNSLKDRLFSIISHDLRSPLNSLISMLNMSKDGHFSAEEEKHILSELSKNVEYNSELLENLLKWASSQMKGNTINPIRFDIYALANQKIRLYEKAAHQKGIEFLNSIDIDTEVFADKDMIELVLRNLITNAIKFSTIGDKIVLSSVQSKGFVEVCVADTGVGISEDTLNKIFSKQVITTQGTKDEKGTGLGLKLCQDFIQINGGVISVESTIDVGSKFFFTLPANNEL
jgi:two-component system sensor histidine kinase/response regulator